MSVLVWNLMGPSVFPLCSLKQEEHRFTACNLRDSNDSTAHHGLFPNREHRVNCNSVQALYPRRQTGSRQPGRQQHPDKWLYRGHCTSLHKRPPCWLTLSDLCGRVHSSAIHDGCKMSTQMLTTDEGANTLSLIYWMGCCQPWEEMNSRYTLHHEY